MSTGRRDSTAPFAAAEERTAAGPPQDEEALATTADPASAEIRLRALTELAKVVAAARRSDDIIALVAVEALAALDADGVTLSRWDREAGVLRVLVHEGVLGNGEQARPSDEVVRPDRWDYLLELLLEGTPALLRVTAPDASDVAEPPEIEDRLRRRGNGSAIAVPVWLEGRVWGELLATRSPNRAAFVPADLGYVRAVGSHVAAGIAQAEHLARVERLAYSDPLTGLANRRALERRLDAVLDQHRVDGSPVSLMVCDVNRLKQINDTDGHAAGDAALIRLARTMQEVCAREQGAMAARLGGDEFCVLLAGRAPSLAVRIAETVCRRASDELPHGVSCGVASTDDLNEAHLDAGALFRLADAAQYRAKRGYSTEPVVAGSYLTPGVTPAVTQIRDRRLFRGRTVDVASILNAATDVLDTLLPGPGTDAHRADATPGAGGAERIDATSPGKPDPVAILAAVADTLARYVDAASWAVSVLPANGDRLHTVDSLTFRLPQEPPESVPGTSVEEEQDGYSMATLPATARALAGQPVVVEDDDPSADATELSLLGVDGFREMAMAGVRDRDGTGWLVEVFADELSVPVRTYSNVLAAVVAISVARIDAAMHS